MAIDNTLLLREVDVIIDEGNGIRSFLVDCRIHTPEAWIDPIRITLFSLERDYESSYGDVVVIEVVVGEGDYAYKLVPYRDALQVDFITQASYRGTDNEDLDRTRRVKRYRAVLMEQDNPALMGRDPQSSNEEDLNRKGFKSVQLQLFSEELYQIRLASVGRLYRQVTPAVALRSLLTETTNLVDKNNRQQIFGVDLVGGYNTKVRNHIVIPDGTALVDVPHLLQNKEGGIYAAGLGCYLQDGYWRVFPAYDTTRYQRTPKALTVISVPPNRYFGAEQTFRVTTNQVVIVAAGAAEVSDEGLFEQLNDGNSVRFTDVEQLLQIGQTSENRTTMSRSDSLFEFTGPELQSGITHAVWAAERATSNPFKHYSALALRNGRYMSVEWFHGDSSLLYPGMPVRLMAAVGDALATFQGVLLGVHDQRIPIENNIVSKVFGTSVRLKLFLTRVDNAV